MNKELLLCGRMKASADGKTLQQYNLTIDHSVRNWDIYYYSLIFVTEDVLLLLNFIDVTEYRVY
jgi:hypothetical protein